MSLVQAEPRVVQDVNDQLRRPAKCRIPQRLPSTRQRSSMPHKTKTNAERPKSGGRVKEEGFGRVNYHVSRPARPERERLQIKRPVIVQKKQNDNTLQSNKRGVITVPMSGPQMQKHKFLHSDLPDQETIRKREALEMERGGLFGVYNTKDKDALNSRSDPTDLKMNWHDYVAQFDRMKLDLAERQKAIIELYASMQNTHQKMTKLGQNVTLPHSEDLTIMNVTKLTPDQLLRLCAVQQEDNDPAKGRSPEQISLAVDMSKMYGLPSRIIATCEQTLFKRKEIIDWFMTLKADEKGISVQSLERKMNEFSAENEMLRCSLEQAKGDFLKDLNEIVDIMRKTTKETVTLQLRTEEQTYEMSELHSENTDLKKQIRTIESLRTNKGKIEEMEKELKEERCKMKLLRERLSRADGQIKIGTERAAQLEAALEQARSQSWTLERTVQQLHKQNLKLQSDYDVELSKFTESIRENTINLEEIAVARETLQAEKEDLEKRLEQLADSYNESLEAVKHEMHVNLGKLMETEKKYQEEAGEKNDIIGKLESLKAQLLDYETRNKELTKQIEENVVLRSKATNVEEALKSTKHDLELAYSDIKDYKERLAEQSETIKLLEHDLEASLRLEGELKSIIAEKEEYITELETKQSIQEKQLQESEDKMTAYEEQLSSLKGHINQLQEDFGEFENLNELHDMVYEQRSKLLEATRQNTELAEALRKKDEELQQHLVTLADNENILEQREGLIKMLSEKEEEQTNIIKLLRTNLEIRTQADTNLSQQISEKNSEIENLIANLETRKQQISQLEQIILTLEEQTRKSSLQRKKDQDKITLLEKELADYEAYHAEDNKFSEVAPNNIDNLIKILEEELGPPLDPQLTARPHEYMAPKNNDIDDRKRELQRFESHMGNTNPDLYQMEHESVPTKMVMGNFVKKTYISNDEQFEGDNLDRKKAITKIDTQKWVVGPDSGINMYAPLPVKDNTFFRGPLPSTTQLKDKNFLIRNKPFLIDNQFRDEKKVLTRNIPLLNTNQFRDGKRCKMFKLAGHSL